jgi:hypothetical protein
MILLKDATAICLFIAKTKLTLTWQQKYVQNLIHLNQLRFVCETVVCCDRTVLQDFCMIASNLLLQIKCRIYRRRRA